MLDALIAEARLRWGLDPAAGFAVVVAERLVATPLEPSVPVLVVPAARLRAGAPAPGSVTPLPGRHGPAGTDPVAVLRRLYPADHPVGRFGNPVATSIGALVEADLATPVYLAPVAPVAAIASPWGMPWISARLRAPDGCPWDREQTHETLRSHLLEEAYEVYDALADGPSPALAGELGDLLLQIILHAQLAAEEGVFDLTDVWAALASKIVRRHPHVFGESEAKTASDVNRQWERIKQAERAAAADEAGAETPKSALDGISRSLPALAASQEMQERAAHLGYDWPSIDGVLDKVREEVGELVEAESDAHRAEELGDLLFVLVNVGRKTGIEVEAALRSANDKFRRRFRHVELAAAARGVALRDMTFEELDALWDAAKAHERGETTA
ncbi:MAG: nucleoside triphosphate pyrophosphohydrolase [Chloroflexota bacterium]